MLQPKTKQEIAKELNISISTLKRKIKDHNLNIPRGLVAPDVQKELFITLGYQCLWSKKYPENFNRTQKT